MAKSILENLPSDVKNWCARAMVGMITADGVVTESELVFLKETISFLEDMDAINEIVKLVKSKEQIILQTLKTDPQTGAQILIHLATLAVTDGKLDDTESNFFIYVGKKMGFPSTYSSEILSWAREYIAINKRRKYLIKKAEHF
ncbi:hypothetical protein WDW89_22705 [Deltaproteobacteria bacterium TL4]